MTTTTQAAAEKWHVRYWTSNRGKRQGYYVMPDSQRNMSGSPIASYKTEAEAQAVCDRHNAEIKD